MKKLLVLLIIAPLLIAAFSPAYCQPADDSSGLSAPFDASVQFVAIASGFFHLDHALRWTDATYAFIVPYALPNAFPASSESRAPPAQHLFLS
jgi:hypothetical protein